jgi:hypothetical protein
MPSLNSSSPRAEKRFCLEFVFLMLLRELVVQTPWRSGGRPGRHVVETPRSGGRPGRQLTPFSFGVVLDSRTLRLGRIASPQSKETISIRDLIQDFLKIL